MEEKNIEKEIKSIGTEISIISWLVFFIFIINLFSSNEMRIKGEVKIEEKNESLYNIKKPKTYCSEEEILYWINGVIMIEGEKQYILNVVYDKNQKPKKCLYEGNDR